jgi:hypothetical protein
MIETSLIHKRATGLSLRFLHMYVFGIVLTALLLDPLWPLAGLPLQMIDPVRLLDWLPHASEWMNWATFLVVFRLIVILTVLAAMTAQKAPVSLLASILYILFQAIEKSYGKLDHDDYVLMFAALSLGLFGDSKRPSIAWVSVLFFMLFFYSLTGIQRVLRGSLSIFTNDSLLWYINYNIFRPGHHIQWDCSRVLSNYPWIYGFFLKPGFLLVTALEILAPLALVQKNFRMIFLAVMLPFFILNWFFMNILFWQSFFLCLLLFEFSHRIRFDKSVKPSPAK